jgi:hypothetical protein
VISALLVAALSVAGALSLILEMGQPDGGLIKISSAPGAKVERLNKVFLPLPTNHQPKANRTRRD